MEVPHMPKVILICGKICSGKTTYARRLCMERKAVLLSCDEITLALFDQNQEIGNKYYEYLTRLENYLYNKSVELIRTGIDVVLDWGFWQKEKRDFAKSFYKSLDIPYEFHYIEVNDAVWNERIRQRNEAFLSGKAAVYFVDNELAAKSQALFEVPTEDEAIDFTVQ